MDVTIVGAGIAGLSVRPPSFLIEAPDLYFLHRFDPYYVLCRRLYIPRPHTHLPNC